MNKIAARISLSMVLFSAAAFAQEPWDTSFHLVGGTFSGAVDGGFGQKTNYGLSMAGAYPVMKQGDLMFELGYRAFPSELKVTGTGSISHKSDGYYGGAWFRYRLPNTWISDVYVQAGLRAWQFMATETVTTKGGNPDGTDLRVEARGPRNTTFKPAIGIGYRLNERISLELNLSGFEAKNAQGTAKSGTLMEISLGIHL